MLTDPSEAETSLLLTRAARYRKLATLIADRQTADALLDLAREYTDMATMRVEAAGLCYAAQ